MPNVHTAEPMKTPHPHGIASGCAQCKHACALAVDRSSTYVQCGNPKCYDYGYWTHGWPILFSYTAEERRCKSFEQGETLVTWRGHRKVSPGYAKAWIESEKRLKAWWQWTHSNCDDALKPPPPMDIHPLGLPDEKEEYYITRSYVRIYHEGEKLTHA